MQHRVDFVVETGFGDLLEVIVHESKVFSSTP